MSRPNQRKRRLKPDKPLTPEVYKASLAAARERSVKRRHGPVVSVEPGSSTLAPPFADCGEDWHYIVVDTFGTRSHAVASVFIDQLSNLVSSDWDAENQEWVPDAGELQTILHVVAAHRPKDEAQAVIAAQIAATHMLTMKVAERVHRYPWDDKAVSSYTKLARTSAALAEAMATIQGRKKATRQKITVRRENHIHYHVGGGASDARPVHERRKPGVQELPAVTDEREAVRGEESDGRVVPLSRRAG
ncbi:hypothetical protein ACFSCW_03325 [Sphingomonas tabacisoli]|uniref:Uncharacterized protein n=1 Tax=Sphingomonas tabacisoli TaxID=2249466 RepID=A0ABW4HYV4_9SPHN